MFKKIFGTRTFRILFSLFAILGVVSCEIGLGSAVDTNPPSVSISYPPASSIIRDTFVLQGTCKDDIALRAVKITLINTDTGVTYPERTAVITKAVVADNPDTWTISLNEKDANDEYEYADGQYEIMAVSVDNSGRTSSTAKLIVDIDNTAPVFLMSKPSSKGDVTDSTLTTFGQVIKLAGDIAETHTTTGLTLFVKNETDAKAAGTPPLKIEINDFADLSSNNPLVIAKYTAQVPATGTPEKALYDNYINIYGTVATPVTSNDNKDKNFFCSVVLKDNARVYNDSVNFPAGDESVTNESSAYYVMTSEVKAMMDKNSYGLDVQKIQKIINGTTKEYDATQIADIKAKISSSKYETKYTDASGNLQNNKVDSAASKFLVNPHNNPTWDIGGYSKKGAGDEGYSEYSIGRPMTLVITAGKDNVEIKPSTVKLELKNKNGTVVNTPINLDWSDSADLIVSKEITFDAELGLKPADNPYKLVLSGKDRDGNDIEATSSNEYGFRIVTANNPPEISVEKIYVDETVRSESESGSYWAGTDLTSKKIKVEFKVKTDSVELGSPIGSHFTIYKDSNKSGPGFSITDKNTNDSKTATVESVITQKDKKGFSYTILATFGGTDASIPSTEGAYKYSFFAVATDTQTKSSGVAFNFYVDSKAPELTISEPSPNVNENSTDYVNGTIKVSGTAADNYSLKDVVYEVYKNGTKVDSASGTFDEDKKRNPELSIDTTEYSDDDTLYVKFIATDEVGNKKEVQTKTYTVKQDTDKPKISGINFYDVTDKSNLSMSKNIFDGNSKFIGTITDDDGIENAVLEIKKADGTTTYGTPESLVKDSEKGSTSISFNQVAVPKDTGFYQLVIEATDTTYITDASDPNKDAKNANRKSTYGNGSTIWFAVDNSAPEISVEKITSPDADGGADNDEKNSAEKLYKKLAADTPNASKDKLTYTIKASDDLQMAATDTVTVSVNGAAPVALTKSGTADTYTYDFDLSTKADGEYVLTFVATDICGKTASVKRTVVFDKTKPKFTTLPSVSPAAPNGWYNSTTLSVTGDVSDLDGAANEGSGISKVEITYGDGKPWSQISGKANFTHNITLTDASGATTIKLRAIDIAGNVKEESFQVNIDTASPEMTLSTVDGIDPSVEKIKNGQSDVVLKGTTNDNSGGSGIDKIELCINSTNFNAPLITISSANVSEISAADSEENRTWTVTVPAATVKALTQANNIIYARVYDKAGNYQEQTLYTLHKDATPPVVIISTKEGEVNGTITFEGTASDDQAMDSVKAAYYDGSEWKALTFDSTSTVNKWISTIDTTTAFGSITDGTDIYLCLIATDKAGNKNLDSADGTDNTDSTTGLPKLTPAVMLAKTENGIKSSLIKITVNQDGDRPVIKFNNIDLDGMESGSIWLKNTSTLIGTITDDDGISYFGYNIDGSDTYEEIKVSNGSWSLSLEDKPYEIYFKVTDTAGTDFFSCEDVTAPDAKKSPKLQSEKTVSNTPTIFEFGNSTNKDSRLKIKVDVEPPKTKSVQYASSKDDGATYTDYSSDNAALLLGGDYKHFAIKLDAQDSNGINSVKLLDSAGTVKGTTVPPASYADGDYHTWEIKDISVTGLNSGESKSVTYTLEVTDEAGMKKSQLIHVVVDNLAATLNVDSHTSGDQIGDSFVLKGTTSNSDDNTTVKYIIDASSTEISATDPKWATAKELKGEVDSWRLFIDNDLENPDGYKHDIGHKQYFEQLYGSSTASGTPYGIMISKSTDSTIRGKIVKKTSAADAVGGTELYTTIKPFYFHFLVIDRNGNKSTSSFNLKIDPQGDIPKVTMTYPANKADGTELRLSGIIRAQGTAEAKNPIKGVYMQIDPDYLGDGRTGFNEAAWQGASKTAPEVFKNYENLELLVEGGSEWGLKVGTETNWNFALNKDGTLNGASGSDSKIAIRLYCVDENNTSSPKLPENDVIIVIDSAKPKIGSSVPFYVYQYAWTNNSDKKTYYSKTATPAADEQLYTDSGCTTAASGKTWNSTGYTEHFASKEFKDNMWLSGEWWLKGSVEDESGISEVTFGGNDIKSASVQKTWTSTRGYIINQKIGSTEQETCGKLTYKLFVKDNDTNKQDNDFDFIIRYDNQAPRLEPKTGKYFDISKSVVNDEGFYTMGSAAYESTTESGFDKVVFYFERKITGTPAIHNVYDSYLQRDTTGSTLAVSGLTYEDGLYSQKGNVTSVNENTVTFTLANDNILKNIHKGGLVKVGGEYYTILSGEGTKTLTLSGKPVAEANSSIYFVIGHVVDNQGAESPGRTFYETASGYGYYKDSMDNTDDYMIEKISTQNDRTVWYGSINSNNIPDGSIEIHYVAFDKAGNIAISNAETVTDAKVENNAPRIASVRVWRDYNDDKTENPGESETFYYSKKERVIGGVRGQQRSDELTTKMIVSGNGKDVLNGGNAIENAVKTEIGFIPEIVGGNGDLFYSYMCGTAAQFSAAQITDSEDFDYNGTFKKKDKVTTSFGTGHNDGLDTIADASGYYRKDDYKESYVEGHTTYIDTADGNKEKSYCIKLDDTFLKAIGNSTSSTDPTWFEFTIWDSTEGTSKFVDSLNAKIQVALDVQYSDSVKPKVVVNPFYWNSLTNNSIYNSKNAASFRDLQGHIELEADWAKALYQADGTTVKDSHKGLDTNLKDTDPKVSGKITIRGTAYDNIRIKQFKFTFPGIGTKVLAGEYSNGRFDSKGTMSTNGWEFAAKDVYNNNDGHKVNWELSLDTSKVTGLTGTNVTFKMYAVDARGKNESLGTNSTDKKPGSNDLDTSDSVYNKPTYQMDVVPYISSITTSLSTYSEDNPSIYDRTTQGHYPVYQQFNGFKSNAPDGGRGYEKVTLNGFNLAANNASIDFQLQYTNQSGTWNYIGANSIPALNNYNLNDAKGSVTKTLTESNYADYAYNRQPNGETNNRLTDDIVFDIWQINSAAAKPDGDRNLCDNVTMKINPSNGMIGFSFSSGDLRWAMPKANDNSYQIWGRSADFCKSVAFDYMSNGITLGVAAGGESGSNYSDAFSFYNSKRNTPGNDTYTYASGMRIESISQYGNKDGQNTSELNLDKDRFQSSSFASLVSGDNRYVYLAYYDQMNGEIRFRAGNIKDNDSYETFTDDYKSLGSSSNTFNNGNNLNNGKYSVSKVQVLASGTGQSLGYSGQYVSIAATSDNTVAMVWYDSKNNCLRMAYTTSPETSRTGAVATGWTNVGSIMANGGDFCQLVVDSENNFHVAAYDNVDGDLKYIYIPKSGTKENNRTIPNVSGKKECIVDSYQSVGKYITLDVAKSGNYQIPYIGYWGSYPKKPRYAYLAEPANIGDGVDDDGMYNGVWECTIVPTPSKVYQDQLLGPERINVGVWKDAGALTDSKVGGENKYNSSTAGNSSGTCYGNGTSNAVIGYQIDLGTKSYIETAQKK